MKLSSKKRPKKSKKPPKFIQYKTHHEIHIEDDEELGIVIGVLAFITAGWWGVVHIIDMFFNKLTWWQEPLTIIPVLLIVLPYSFMVELYGKNPLHWWPAFWGTKVAIPERQPFRAYDSEMEKMLEEFGPMRVYTEDYTTLKFRCKKDAVVFSLKNF